MPQGSIRINRALTNLSVHYKNEEYIAAQVLPDLPVMKESDLYWIYNSDRMLPETARANGSPANMVTFDASTSSYNCKEHSVKDVITDRDYMNAESELMIDQHTMENLIDKIMMRQEFECAKLCFTTTTWGNNATLATATSWNYNTTTSAPIQNVGSATTAMIAASGKRPNLIVMNQTVFQALKDNPNVYGRIQYVERAIVTTDLLASIFDVQKVLVGTAAYNGAKEGETLSMTSIWSSDCLVAYVAPRPQLRDASAGVTMRVKQFGSPYKVKKWRDEEIDGNYIEVQSMFTPKAVATSCAYFFKTVAAV